MRTHSLQPSNNNLLSEVLSYLGGVVILISAAFIVAQVWEPLGAWGRSGLVVVAAAILFAAAWILTDRRHDDMIRRLSAALFAGSAVLVAIAVVNLLRATMMPEPFIYQPSAAWKDPAVIAIAAAAALIVAIIGYAKAHSMLGQVVMAASAVFTLIGLGTAVQYYQDQSDFGFGASGFWLVLALGIGWIAISRVGAFAEPTGALAVGVVLVFIGGQGVRGMEDVQWAGGAIALLIGAAFLALYLWWRAWPMLVGAVLAILSGGTELFVRYFEGIGAALASLALGVLLLGFGLVLLRKKSSDQEVGRS